MSLLLLPTNELSTARSTSVHPTPISLGSALSTCPFCSLGPTGVQGNGPHSPGNTGPPCLSPGHRFLSCQRVRTLSLPMGACGEGPDTPTHPGPQSEWKGAIIWPKCQLPHTQESDWCPGFIFPGFPPPLRVENSPRSA